MKYGLAALGGLLIGTAIGAVGSGGTPATPTSGTIATTTVTAAAAPAVTETVQVPGPAQTTVKLPAVTKTVVAQPPAPKAAIEEGVWVVGEDIAPGTYRTIEPVTEGCYWMITKSGTNGADIIQNDLPTGGRPTVTLRRGQDFKTEGCGSWAKR